MTSNKVKISKVNPKIVEEKIANLILKYRKDLTVEDAETIAKMTVTDPVYVLTKSPLDIVCKHFDIQTIILN